MMKHYASLLGLILFPMMLLYSCSSKTEPELAGWAKLSSATFSDGPTSGQFIESKNGVPVPFANKQPVQGFSAILSTGDNQFLLLSDNGFGSKSNSSDYLLRVTRVSVSFAGSKADTPGVAPAGYFNLSDPQKLIPFQTVLKRFFVTKESLGIYYG